MRTKDIYCLMTFSVSITSRMADILFETGCDMLLFNDSRRAFKTNFFEGVITTSFEMKSMSGITGVEFFAEVESELGKGKVKFLLRKFDIEMRNEMVNIPFNSTEDLIAHLGGRPSQYNPAYN